MPSGVTSDLQNIIDRLDLALSILPAMPVIAAEEVDIAWLYLVNIFPDQLKEVSSSVSATETPLPPVTSTPTVAP